MTRRLANVGTISHGTLRTEDLLSAFASELEWNVQRNAVEWCSDEGRECRDRYLALAAEASEIEDFDSEAAIDLVNELQDSLNEFAPAYCYFGANEGDGSDFGFWPCLEEIEELERVSDPSEVEHHLGEACVFVNDHGNMTVYNADGTIALELV